MQNFKYLLQFQVVKQKMCKNKNYTKTKFVFKEN